MIGMKILSAVAGCFYVYYLMMLIRCLLTFLPFVDWNNKIINGLRMSVDIYLDIFKKFIPPIGGFDFSPIAGFFILEYVIKKVVLFVLAVILGILGLL